MSSVPPPPPLEYVTPSPPIRRRVIDVWLMVMGVLAALATTFVVFIVVPRMEMTYRDFGTGFPTSTVLLLKFAHGCWMGGIVVVWAVFLGLPFLAPALEGPTPTGQRRRFHPTRLLFTLFLALFFGWMIFSVFLAYINLITTVSSTGKN